MSGLIRDYPGGSAQLHRDDEHVGEHDGDDGDGGSAQLHRLILDRDDEQDGDDHNGDDHDGDEQ